MIILRNTNYINIFKCSCITKPIREWFKQKINNFIGNKIPIKLFFVINFLKIFLMMLGVLLMIFSKIMFDNFVISFFYKLIIIGSLIVFLLVILILINVLNLNSKKLIKKYKKFQDNRHILNYSSTFKLFFSGVKKLILEEIYLLVFNSNPIKLKKYQNPSVERLIKNKEYIYRLKSDSNLKKLQSLKYDETNLLQSLKRFRAFNVIQRSYIKTHVLWNNLISLIIMNWT